MNFKLATVIFSILMTVAGPVAVEAGRYGRHYPPPRYRWNPHRDNYHRQYRNHWHWYGAWRMGMYLALPPPPPFVAVPSYRGTAAGAVDTDIDPEEAAIYIDGKYQGQADDFDGFPSYLYLAPGTYQLDAYIDGYQPLNITIDVRPGRLLRLEQKLVPASRWRAEDWQPAPDSAPPEDEYPSGADGGSWQQPPGSGGDQYQPSGGGSGQEEDDRRPPWRGERY